MSRFIWILALLVAMPAFGQFGGEPSVTLEVVPARTAVMPGDRTVVAVILNHREGYHSWPAKVQDVLPPELDEFAIRTSVEPSGDGFRAGTKQWPTPTPALVPDLVDFEGTMEALTYHGRAVVYVPIEVDTAAAAGPLEITFDVAWQACNDKTCDIPEEQSRAVSLQIVTEQTARADIIDPDLFTAFEAEAAWATDVAEAETSETQEESTEVEGAGGVGFDFGPWRFTLDSSATLLAFPLAFLAGLILNFTPCVLPVIPLKIMSIQKHAQEPAKLILYGTAYCVGIVLCFVALAVLVLPLGQAWGELNSYWQFSVPMAIVVAVLGLGMMDLYTIRLPQKLYMFNPSGDSVTGNTFLGVLTALLSTPCTGPLLGGALVWAASQPSWVGMTAVITMGVGMASPYALLMLFPGLMKKMPKAGPGSKLLKEFIGIMMLAVAVYILSFLTESTWTWWAVGAIAAGACIWLYIGSLAHLQTANGKILGTHLAIVLMLVTWATTRSLTGSATSEVADAYGAIPWITFKGEAADDLSETVDAALESGQIVVVDFTAKWCANCHVIEKTILNSARGRQLLTDSRIVPIKVDLTRKSNKQGYALLEELSGKASIPFLAVMGPERPRDRAVTFSSFFPVEAMVEAAQDASGSPLELAGR